MTYRRSDSFVAALALTGGIAVVAQDVPPTGLRFEAASIRPAAPGGPPISGTTIQTNRLRGTKVSLLALIRSVYFAEGLTSNGQFTGGPEWIATERWDIDAVAATTSTRTQFNEMRNLLTDRFKLRVRREVRELPVFALLPARADRRLGPKLTGVTVDCTPFKEAFERVQSPPRREPGAPLQPTTCAALVSSRPDGISIAGRAIELSQLARTLTSYFDAPVVDQTELFGRYDVDLTFVRDPGAASADGVALETALREQLGLRVERQRAPMEALVIESAERPTQD